MESKCYKRKYQQRGKKDSPEKQSEEKVSRKYQKRKYQESIEKVPRKYRESIKKVPEESTHCQASQDTIVVVAVDLESVKSDQ